MEHVIIERVFETPIDLDAYVEMARRGAWCFALYRVRHLRSYVSPDRLRMACVCRAPDAEAVRRLGRELGVPGTRVWTASIHFPPDAEGMTEGGYGAISPVVVERRFDAPVAVEDIQAIEDRGAWCLEMHRVRFLRTYFSADRRNMLCLYEAPDAEAVRRAQRQAGMPFELVWPAEIFEFPPGVQPLSG